MGNHQKQRKLFKAYPLDAEVVIDGQTLSSPYQVYDGTMLMIGGTVNAERVAKLLENEDCRPILDANGRAFMVTWVCEFTDANLGAHGELQFAFLAAPSFKSPLTIKPHPYALLKVLIEQPDVFLVCHGLWNDVPRVVQYNAQHLKLKTNLFSGKIVSDQLSYTFSLKDANMQSLIEGSLLRRANQHFKDMMSLSAYLGFKNLMKMARQPWFEARVMNIKNEYVQKNYLAKTATSSKRQFVRQFNADDHLKIAHPTYVALDFTPQFVEQIEAVNFVYLRPEI